MKLLSNSASRCKIILRRSVVGRSPSAHRKLPQAIDACRISLLRLTRHSQNLVLYRRVRRRLLESDQRIFLVIRRYSKRKSSGRVQWRHDHIAINRIGQLVGLLSGPVLNNANRHGRSGRLPLTDLRTACIPKYIETSSSAVKLHSRIVKSGGHSTLSLYRNNWELREPSTDDRAVAAAMQKRLQKPINDWECGKETETELCIVARGYFERTDFLVAVEITPPLPTIFGS